jgi:hypothetical protein
MNESALSQKECHAKLLPSPLCYLSIGLNSPEKNKKKKSPEEGVTHISSLIMHRVLETKTKNKKKEEKKNASTIFCARSFVSSSLDQLIFLFLVWFVLFCFVLFCVPWIS